MPVQITKRLTTTSEFFDWQKFFALEAREPHREDYLFARLYWELRRSGGERNIPSIEDLRVSFSVGKSAPATSERRKKELTPEEKRAYIEQQKNLFKSFFQSSQINKGKKVKLKFPKPEKKES